MRELRRELLARGLSPRSAKEYGRIIRKANEWCESRGHALSTVPSPVFMDFVHAQPRGWATRKCLRSALTHYWAIEGRTDPPSVAIKLPPKPRMVCRALEEDDARILAKAARERRDGPGLAVMMGLYLALRREEIARLRWDDFGRDFLEVRVLGKRAVLRTVPVHPRLRERLVEVAGDGWVFPSKRRGPGHVSPATIWTWVGLVSDEAGVPRVAPHVLRHTCLATQNDATGDLRAVQEFAGHADPEVTAGYTRASQRRLNAVMMALDY